ncbi:unnamed protein product [Clonostachys byssicola]|uniref:Uncharacterized protein n=1 Tax=Clonostachys byssicola TaxID=160290 RepID=A0A9N9Y3S7_9HYPO|nr:unnamed protein product [Clonostachys byssicola]
MDIDNYQRLTEVFNFDNTPILAAGVASFVCGYLQYVYAIRLTLREGKGPMPFWMHSFYLAHDSTWSYLLANAAPRYDNHWFLWGTSFALAIWAALEIFCIHRDVTKNREHIFAPLFGPQPQLPQILCYVVMMQLSMYSVVAVLIVLMGEGSVMQWFCLTNVLIVVGPITGYLERGSRDGLSLGFALTNVVAIIFTFAPFSFWALSIPELFTQPAYYAAGVVQFLMSLYGVYIVASYPPKKRPKYGPKPIW